MKKVISILTDILVTIVFTFAAIFTASSISRGYANFCDYTVVQVLSNSMVASGIERGDVKMIGKSDDYRIGDIIAFHYQSGDDDIILYHEIVEETEDGGFITKGSSNELPEANVTYSNAIIGKQVNNGNYKILVSVPFKVTLILVSYAITMAYIIWCAIKIIKDDKQLEAANSVYYNDFTCPPGAKKLRRKRKHSIHKHLCVLLLFITACGFIPYNAFAIGQPSISATHTISFVKTITGWTNSDILSDEFYQAAEDLEYALSHPDSEQGQALTAAIAAKKSTDWMGNMDNITQVSNNLDEVMTVSNGVTYIIKIFSNGDYELYMTNVNYQNKSIYSTFSPVYRTVYEKQPDGTYKATESTSGSCQVTYYDQHHMQWQKSFNTDTFTAN